MSYHRGDSVDRSSANVQAIHCICQEKRLSKHFGSVIYLWFGAVIGMGRIEKCNTYLQCLIPELARKQKLLLDLI
jgi:hypothetical protein